MLLCAALVACEPPAAPGPVSTHVDDWRDEVVYQIVVDRFDDGDPSNDAIDGVALDPTDLARMQGGDWRGIRNRLDYIEALGATTLWISPPYVNVPRTEQEDGYHGYWPSDFTEASERFGGMAELRALVRDAHERGMLVILDVVPNHAGRVFTYDLDADGEVDPGETEPPFSETPYASPLLWSYRPRMWTEEGELTLEAEHFHRRGAGDLSDPRQKELADFPSGLRDLDTEREDVIAALVRPEEDALLASVARLLRRLELPEGESGKVDAVIVDVGGFLGIGEKEVAVGMDNLKFLSDEDGELYLYTDFTEEQLEAQAEYDESSYAENRDEMRMNVPMAQ